MPNEFVARNGIIALNNTQITGSLNVSGSIVATGDITGSNSRFSGTITAQTLVVQVVSSSIEYASGSNIFGTLATNTQRFTGSVLISGSISVSGSVINTLTSSFAVTASQAISSSYALVAQNVLGSITSASYALSSSFSATASYALNAGSSGNIDTGSLVTTSSFNTYTASINATISDILIETASLNLATASLNSYTASINAKTGSFATTGSNTFAGNQIINGTITAQTLIVQTISSSIEFVTGSTKFGSLATNTHQFTGSVSMTGSLAVIGSLSTIGDLIFQNATTASDGGIIGNELTTTGGGANWAGTNFATGYTHTVGSTTALSSSLSPSFGNLYQITWTITGRTAGTITILFGSYSSGAVSTSGTSSPRTTSTTSLSITPTTDFDGTIVLSIKRITSSSALATFKSSNSSTAMEIRASSAFGNVFIGSSAGSYTTTGGFNIGIGFNALGNNTTGYSNTAIGYTALYNNTVGIQNTIYGYGALYSNTTGNNNTVNGYNALNNIMTGSNNVAIGHTAGSSTNAGTNTGTDNSIYIGYNTKAQADNQTNQIVIGYNVVGLGSNSTVIGNSSTTLTGLYGNLVLGGNAITGSATGSGYTLNIAAPSTNGALQVSGSSSFTGSLNVSGSITTTGTITAQTLVVQTVSSSVIYSSGSNVFGNNLANTQTFTGSVGITGSLTTYGDSFYRVSASAAPFMRIGVASGLYPSLTAFNSSGVAKSQWINANGNMYFDYDGTGGANLSFRRQQDSDPNTVARFLSSGNLILQNGAGYTDNGYKVQILPSGSASSALFVSGSTLLSGSLTVTGSVSVNGNALITGSLTIGSGSAGASENTLTLGARDSVNEGGQLGLNAPGGTYTSASMFDNYQNRTRLLRGSNTGSDAEVAWWSMHTKQMALPAYTGSGAFPGSAAGYLAVDSSGNIITAAGTGGSTTPGGSNTQIQYNNSNTFGGVPTLTYDGTLLRATGSFTGSFTGSLQGTSSFATTASFALNSGGGGGMAIGGSITSATSGSVLFASASGVLAQDNANFYYDFINGKLGLGTTTPRWLLEISKSTASTSAGTYPAISINNANAAGYTGIYMYQGLTQKGYFEFANATDSFNMNSPAILNLQIATVTKLSINSSGQTVLTGGSSYSALNTGGTLFVYNPVSNANLVLGANGITANIIQSRDSTTSSWPLSLQPFGGNVGIGTTTIGSTLQVNGNAAIGYSASIAAPSNGLLVSGSVGIGKTAPSASLDVSGSVLITGSLGITGNITGSNARFTGTITSTTLVVQTITSSIIYSSGSNIFGNKATDFHLFTGSVNITGSLNTIGPVSTTGPTTLTGSFTTNADTLLLTGSLIVTGSTLLIGTVGITSASIENQQIRSTNSGSYQVVTNTVTGSYKAAFFDYVIFSGSATRAGTVVSTWSNTAVDYYENYTNDVSGSTSKVTLRVALSGSNVQLQATSSNAAWTIRSLIRLI
jgi:hypothetical protein